MGAPGREAVLRKEWLRVWRDMPRFLKSRGLCGQGVGPIPADGSPRPLCCLPEKHSVPCGSPANPDMPNPRLTIGEPRG